MLRNATDGFNRQHARDAIAVLFDPADNAELIYMGPGGIRTGHRTAADVVGTESLDRLDHADTLGGGLYFGPNPRRALHGGGKRGRCVDADVLLARCLFVDFDDHTLGDVMAAIHKAGLPDPTLIVYTRGPEGRGWHCYWRMAEPFHDPDRWRALQSATAKAVGADPTICNPSRIMRLPGSYNYKRGARCGVHSINTASRPDPGAWPIVARVVTPPAHGEARPDRFIRRDGLGWPNVAASTLGFLNSDVPTGERNQRLYAAACDLCGNGIARGEAEPRLRAAAQRHGLAAGETSRSITSAYAKQRDPVRSGLPPLPGLARTINARRGYPVQGGAA